MKLPNVTNIPSSVQQMEAFGGLNRRAVPADNEFADMCNLSPNQYPALTVRDKRYYNEGLNIPAVTDENSAKELLSGIVANVHRQFRVRASSASTSEVEICGVTFKLWEYGDIYRTQENANDIYHVTKLTESELPGELNIKLHYADNLMRIVPQGGGAHDKLIYGGLEIPEWQELMLSRYADLARDGKNINSISIAHIGTKVLIAPYMAWFDTKTKECGALNYSFDDLDYYNETTHLRILFMDGTAPNIITYARSSYGFNNGQLNELRNIQGSGVYRCRRQVQTGRQTTIDDWEQINSLIYRIEAYKTENGVNKPLFPVEITKNDGVEMTFQYTQVTEGSSAQGETTPNVKSTVLDGKIRVFNVEVKPTYSVLDFSGEPDTKMLNTIAFTMGSALNTKECSIMPGDTYYTSAERRMIYPTRIKFSREELKMEYLCAVNNRIWGCGADGHEIYCSALGNIFAWNLFDGSAGDSWAATVGEGDEWTGAIAYNDAPHFFKRDRVVSVTGTKPSNFGYRQYSLAGCVDNASCAIVSDKLFYMGADGIYVYSGAVPQRISDKIGGTWKSGVGAGFRGKYYLSRTQESGENELLVYDTDYNTWYRESGNRWYSAFSSDENLYFTQLVDFGGVSENVWGTFLPLRGYEFLRKIEDDLEWYGVTGDFHDDPYSKKYITRLDLSMSLERGAVCNVYISYDDSQDWRLLQTITQAHKDTEPIRILPKRCNRFRLKFAGRGGFVLYNITKTVEEAGEYV